MIEGLVRSIADRLRDFWVRKMICRGDPVRWARRFGARIGEDCRILTDPRKVFGSEPYLITLGNHVSITASSNDLVLS